LKIKVYTPARFDSISCTEEDFKTKRIGGPSGAARRFGTNSTAERKSDRKGTLTITSISEKRKKINYSKN